MQGKDAMRHTALMIGFLSGALLWADTSVGGPGDMVQTASKVIKEVQIQVTAAGAVYYYFVTEGGWQVQNCSGLLYPYIAEDAAGAKAIFAAAITSKTTQSPLTFTGICGDTNGDTRYLQIRFVTF